MAGKDLYEVLGVPKGANADELKSAYRRLAKKYHPDVYATAPAEEKAKAEEKFKEIQHAYDVLSDPQKKAAYDQYGSEDGPMAGGFGGGFNPFNGAGGGAGFGDFFNDIFSAFTGSGNRTNVARAGDDIEIGITLSFKEAAFGCKKDIQYQRVERCHTCKGTGAKDGTAFKVCTKCGGKGRVTVTQRTMLGMMRSEQICDMCGGTGKIIVDTCPDCKGKGQFKKQHSVQINIPAGVDNGQMLTVQGDGNAGYNGGPNGNLTVVFHVQPHAVFRREGVNLHMDYPITVAQAILGDTVEIPTLTKPARIEIPEGTQDGTVIRVKNCGIKSLRRDAYGDLFVRVVIDVPRGFSAKEKKELKDGLSLLKSGKYDKIEKYNKTLKSMDR